MSKDVHLSEDAAKLRKDITGQMAPLLSAEISPFKQLDRLEGVMKHMWGTYWEQFKVMNIGKMKIKMLFSIKEEMESFQLSTGKFSPHT